MASRRFDSRGVILRNFFEKRVITKFLTFQLYIYPATAVSNYLTSGVGNKNPASKPPKNATAIESSDIKNDTNDYVEVHQASTLLPEGTTAKPKGQFPQGTTEKPKNTTYIDEHFNHHHY